MKASFSHIATLTLALCCAGWPQDSGQPAPGQYDARARYADLTKKIYGVRQRPALAEYEKITNQLRALLNNAITASLRRGADADIVRKAVADVQGDFVLSSWGPDTNNVPFAETFELAGKAGVAVAFGILRGGEAIPDTLPVLQFYVKEPEGWVLRSEVDSDFRGRTFSVARLESPSLLETWWLAWGQTIGDTGARRKVRLYSFDGDTVKTLWQRDGLEAARVRVAEDKKTIILDYYQRQGSPEAPRPPLHIREEWVVTLEGPALVSTTILGVG